MGQVTRYRMQVKMGAPDKPEWHDVHPTGGAPYEYETEKAAREEAVSLYPCHVFGTGPDAEVRVRPVPYDRLGEGLDPDEVRELIESTPTVKAALEAAVRAEWETRMKKHGGRCIVNTVTFNPRTGGIDVGLLWREED